MVMISKKNCRKRWDQRYHHIIDESMICAKDGLDTDAMSAVCSVRLPLLFIFFKDHVSLAGSPSIFDLNKDINSSNSSDTTKEFNI